MVQVPNTTEDASAAFVTDALRAGGVLDAESSVAELTHARIGQGVGLMCDLARLSLRYQGPAVGAPSSVILKVPSSFPENRMIGDALNFYEREGRFYEQVASSVPIRVADCYYNHIDKEANEFALLIEDLGARTMISQVAGISIERAADALRTIARLHAQFWESPVMDQYAWLPRAIDPEVISAGEQYRLAWPRFVELFGANLPDGAIELGERVAETWESTQTAMYQRSPETLGHGDFRADNLMFDDDSSDDDRVGVLDFQISFRVPGINDVCYLVTQSMTVEDRRKHERACVDVWYDALCSALGSAPDGYDVEDAWTDYRTATGNMTVYAVVGGGAMDLSNERGVQLATDMANRSFAAALDLDAAGLIPS